MSKIMKDKKAYLTQYYSTQSVPEAVIKKLPPEDNPRVFSDIKMIFESKETEGDKVTTKKVSYTYSGLGNGLVPLIIEHSSNDIVRGYNFNLSYKGMYGVKWVYGSTGADYTNTPYEIKEVKRWDALGTKEGDVSLVDFRWGTSISVMNFDDGQYKCTVGKTYEAKEINPKLAGQARNFDCETHRNGTAVSRNKYALLLDLGFAVPLEFITASDKTEYKLLDVINP